MSSCQGRAGKAILIAVLSAHGLVLFVFGEVASAREHCEQMITLYDPQQQRSYALYGIDLGVGGRGNVAFVLWLLGYPDQALERMRDAFTLAQDLSHLQSIAFALSYAAMLHQLCWEGHVAQERAEATVALSNEQGFPMYLGWGTIVRGWVLTEQGQGEQGIAQIRQGLAAYRPMGGGAFRPYFLALLAEAYGKAEQAEEGLAVLAEALEFVHKTGERFYEAELYRLKGELTLAQSSVQSLESRVKEAEACFHKTIEIAQRQQAKSLELRAVISLARLWQQQGKQHEAHSMLSEIYGWFTEGFDTRDLQDAKMLIEELAEGGRYEHERSD